ncbi:MAG: ankyrin repeat domain-containing protein [Chloroflexota bacterium]
MNTSPLAQSVFDLAHATHSMTDADLGQPWAWGPHEEGVRFALLGTCHELRDLAARLAHLRAQDGRPPTAAQRILGQYHAAYRDLQAILLGVTDELYGQEPAAGEWPLRYVLGHAAATERHFFTLVHYGLERQRDGGERPTRLPDGQTDRVVGPRSDFIEIMENQPMTPMLVFYDHLHQRALREFATMTDAELEGKSVWWENIEYPLRHRLHRFEMHLRQHTVQAEKTLALLNQPPNEAKRLLRHVYNALAEVEAATFGADGLGADEQVAIAATIRARAEEVRQVVAQARAMIAAVQSNGLPEIQTLLAANPKLAKATSQSGVSAVLIATYYGHPEAAQALIASGLELDIFEAAATGRLDTVQAWVNEWEPLKGEYNVDGFYPLGLACFFGHEATALWLIEKGADVNQVAKNRQRVRPIHATAANGNLTVLKALLEKGAEVNAKQEGDFTALHEAAHTGNLAMARLLLEYGADKTAVASDKTPYQLAVEKEHTAVADLLAP